MVVKAAEDAAKAAVLEGKKQVAHKHLIAAIAEQQRASQSLQTVVTNARESGFIRRHLPLLRRSDGAALPAATFSGQSTDSRQSHKPIWPQHRLGGQVATVTGNWQSQQTARVQDRLPLIGDGIPLLLQIDNTLDIDDLQSSFGFEIISEEDDGFVIVASEDQTLGFFQENFRDFVGSIEGSAGIARIHELSTDVTQESS